MNADPLRSPRLLNGALSQRDRLVQAPRPQAVAVDGRSKAELLAFAARYGALIRFYDIADQPQGDWSAFFTGDRTVSAAVRAALDLPEIEAALRLLIAEARAAEGAENRHAHVRRAHRVVIRLLIILDGEGPDGGDEEEVDVTLRLTLVAGRDRRDRIAGPLGDLHRHHQRRSDHRDWYLRDLELLEEIASALLAELEDAAEAARAEIETSLHGRGHAPQAALWNAFVELYEQARHRMNGFPRRLLDFYYGDVLRQSRREAVPAQAYLTFTPTAGVASASVPKGTAFLAGTDANGDPILYVARSSLAVVPATVTALRVRRVTDDNGVLSGVVAPNPPGGGAFPAFGGNHPGDFGALMMQSASIGFIVSSPSLMLTGGDRHIKITLASAVQQASTPVVVPAVAPVALPAPEPEPAPAPPPPVALVAEPVVSPAPFVVAPEKSLAATALTAVSAVPEVTPMIVESLAAAGTRLLEDGDAPTGLWFSLSYSTAGGWMTVERAHFQAVRRNAEGAQALIFSFALPPGAPPLVATSTKPGPGAPTPTLPASAYPDLADEPTMIAQLLDHPAGPPGSLTAGVSVTRSAYKILAEIKVATVTVAVTVDGLVPPQMASSAGVIDPTHDFALFGLAPPKGASFTVSAPELFVKVPARLALTIDWAGRPTNSTGFAGWYQDYVIDGDGQTAPGGLFDNSSFRVGFGLTGQARWTLDQDPSLYLFRTDRRSNGLDRPEPSAPVEPRSLLAVQKIAAAPEPSYFDPTANALKLTLLAPDEGFGDTLYARNLMAASAANAAAAQARSSDDTETRLAAARTANAGATSKTYAATVGAAIQTVVAALNADALTACQAAIAASGADAADQSIWRAALTAAVNPAGRKAVDDAGVTTSLQGWSASHRAGLTAKGANPSLDRADALLTQAAALTTAWTGVAKQPIASARPQVSAALQAVSTELQLLVPPPILPNPPWLPTASAVAIDYAASDVRQWSGEFALAAEVDAAAQSVDPGDAVSDRVPQRRDPARGTRPYRHLNPFHKVSAPHSVVANDARPTSETWLLPPQDGEAALHIDLSAPVDAITLLFVLEAGPHGWSAAESVLRWEKEIGDVWTEIALIEDSTNGLRNTGLVSLQVATSQHDFQDVSQNLRVVLEHGSTNAAYISSVTANAVTVVWEPPAGADMLAAALPPGTISQSQVALAGIASIDQPMQSFGGVPPATGRDFDQWMAEHLRHKGRAIASDDYARLVLAAIPTLWQLAVVPATDEITGRAAPGKIWLVAVAGPQTPNIADPTVPLVDPGTLTQIGELASAIASPFAQLTVTNPPWRRIQVAATLVFSADDTPAGWIARLQKELTSWLSPWPDAALGYRGSDYWTRQAIAEFVRRRPYVKGIVSLTLGYDSDPGDNDYYYYTSAQTHKLEPFTPPVDDHGGQRVEVR